MRSPSPSSQVSVDRGCMPSGLADGIVDFHVTPPYLPGLRRIGGGVMTDKPLSVLLQIEMAEDVAQGM